MKSSTDKVVIVKLNGVTYQVTVDSAIYDDIFVEAVTRVVEKHRKNPSYFHKMRVIAECYEKKDAKSLEGHFQINMYHILLNAGLYSIAELLREKTKNAHSVDLQLEPVRVTHGTPQ